MGKGRRGEAPPPDTTVQEELLREIKAEVQAQAKALRDLQQRLDVTIHRIERRIGSLGLMVL